MRDSGATKPLQASTSNIHASGHSGFGSWGGSTRADTAPLTQPATLARTDATCKADLTSPQRSKAASLEYLIIRTLAPPNPYGAVGQYQWTSRRSRTAETSVDLDQLERRALVRRENDEDAVVLHAQSHR